MAQDSLNVVYLFPTDANGEEKIPPIPLTLKPDGSVDLGMVDTELRETWEQLGVSNMLGSGMVFPSDGEAFLRALLRIANPCLRIRSSAH